MNNSTEHILGKSMLQVTKDNKNLLRVAMEIAGHGDRTGDDSITDQIAVKSSGEIQESYPPLDRRDKSVAARKAQNIARTDALIAKNNPGMSGKRAEDARRDKFRVLVGPAKWKELARKMPVRDEIRRDVMGTAFDKMKDQNKADNIDRMRDMKRRSQYDPSKLVAPANPKSGSPRRPGQKFPGIGLITPGVGYNKEDTDVRMNTFADFIIEQLHNLEETLDFELQDSDLDFAINSIIDNLLD